MTLDSEQQIRLTQKLIGAVDNVEMSVADVGDYTLAVKKSVEALDQSVKKVEVAVDKFNSTSTRLAILMIILAVLSTVATIVSLVRIWKSPY